MPSSLLSPLLLASRPLLQAPPVLLLLRPLTSLLLGLQLPLGLALLRHVLRVAERHEEASISAEGKAIFGLWLSHLTSHP